MLYEIDKNKTLQPLEFYGVGDLNKNEKDLEKQFETDLKREDPYTLVKKAVFILR